MNSRKGFDYDAILADWQRGLSGKELRAKYGCQENLGTILAKKHGVSRTPAATKILRSRRSVTSKESLLKSARAIKAKCAYPKIAAHALRHGLPAAATKFGYSVSRVRNIARLFGWKRPPVLTEAVKAAILADYLAGMSLTKVAAKYGCSEAYPSKLARLKGEKRDPALNKRNAKPS